MVNGGLTGKTIIVTGGGRGLGRTMAFGLAREGANVCIAAHIQDDILSVEQEVKELNYGGKLMALLADIRSPQACREIVDKSISTFSSIF